MKSSAAPNSASPGTGGNLTRRTTSGFSWLAVQTVVSKVLNFGGQIALAWLLMPEHWGLVGLAMTFSSFVMLLQGFGLREVLIQRHGRFRRWYAPAFSLAVVTGAAGTLVIALLAPVAALVYQSPSLIGLMCVIAPSALLRNLGVVPRAYLEGGMRYRLLACVLGGGMAGRMGLAVLLAALGFGAYSFVIPITVQAGAEAVLFWKVAGLRLPRRAHVRRWRFVVRDSSLVLVTMLLGNATSQGGFIVLGIMYVDAVVGLYFFAYRLAAQSFSLLSANLNKVMLSALSQLKDTPARQARAAVRACAALAVAVVPLCTLQAALADPLIRLVFESKWYEAIPALQILSLALCVQSVYAPQYALFQAQGRFGLQSLLVLASAAVFFLCIVPAAWWGGVTGLAAGAAIANLVRFPPIFYIATRPGEVGFREVVGIIVPPALAAALAIGLIPVVISYLEPFPYQEVTHIGAVLIIGCPGYWLLVRRLAPKPSGELRDRVKELVGRRLPRRLARSAT